MKGSNRLILAVASLSRIPFLFGAFLALCSLLSVLSLIPTAEALQLPSDGDELIGADTMAATIVQQTTVLVGAGDIASCSYERDEQTATLLDNIAGTVFTAGDNVYPDGTDQQFNACYGPTWGRHKARTRPSPGNHDHNVRGASGYFKYFGAAAGEVGKGYYSYNIEGWHIIVLNSACANVGGCTTSSPQGQWLQADLAANPRTCTLAYWHRPLFNSGAVHGGDAAMRDFWRLLYEAGADIVLNGHEHLYERFALQDPYGVAAPGRGIRQFTVGTGGGFLYRFGTVKPNSQVRNSDTHGVLKLTLHRTSYDWEFVPVAGRTFTDSGSASCVLPLNTPFAADDTGAVAVGATLNQPAPGVLGNDIDPENDPLTVTTTPVTPPAHGSLTLHADGSYTYIHNGSETVTDSFVYQVCDPGPLCDTATVNLTIGPVNSAPVVDAGTDQMIALSASASLDGTVTDDGLPNPPGTLTSTWSQVSGPGTVTFANASATDTFASFSQPGTYVLRLAVSDGALSTADEVTIFLLQEEVHMFLYLPLFLWDGK